VKPWRSRERLFLLLSLLSLLLSLLSLTFSPVPVETRLQWILSLELCVLMLLVYVILVREV
jgi:hypothetical protein